MDDLITREQEKKIRQRQRRVRKLMATFVLALVVAFFLGVGIGRLTALHDVDVAVRDQGYENPQLGKLLSIVHGNEEEETETQTQELEPEVLEVVGTPQDYTRRTALEEIKSRADKDERYLAIYENDSIYPDRLLVDLANNPEMLDFVAGYPDGGSEEDALTKQELKAKCPLLLQWDSRWGYQKYGDSSCIAVSGCGPTALAMAVVSLTDEEVTPAEVAQYAMDHGYYLKGTGTLWKLMTDGAAHYGLNSEKIRINQEEMEQALDYGNVLILSVKKGDFTNIGHFIVVYGYDENGFMVNDPFCKYKSSLQWSYDQLSKQTKAVWSLHKK